MKKDAFNHLGMTMFNYTLGRISATIIALSLLACSSDPQQGMDAFLEGVWLPSLDAEWGRVKSANRHTTFQFIPEESLVISRSLRGGPAYGMYRSIDEERFIMTFELGSRNAEIRNEKLYITFREVNFGPYRSIEYVRPEP